MSDFKIGDKVVFKDSVEQQGLRASIIYTIKRVDNSRLLIRYDDVIGWQYEVNGITYFEGKWKECVVNKNLVQKTRLDEPKSIKSDENIVCDECGFSSSDERRFDYSKETLCNFCY